MKYILLLLIALFSVQSYAVDDGDWWLQRQIQIGDGKNQYGKNVYGKAARSVMEDVPLKDGTGSRVEQLIKRSIAVDKPTPTKVGTPMLKRISHVAKTPGVQIVGAYAVIQLLEAIGWVMKDGTYIKIKDVEDPGDCVSNSCKLVWANKFGTPDLACKSISSDLADRFDGYSVTYLGYVNYKTYSDGSAEAYCKIRVGAGSTPGLTHIVGIPNPDYIPNDTKPITHSLTPALLGAAMLGTGYKDPVDSTIDSLVNTGDYTSVKEVYEHDPSGVGNELAKDMDQKLKNAKPTDTPSYVGDPKYDSRPLSDDNSSDRAWDEKGGEATGGTEQEKDPETGEPTGNQSITIQFPLFCSWASSMCQWYDDWKASDQVHQKFEEDVKDHQKDEKSFWQTVKDWFDWTKEEPEPEESETPQVDDQGIFKKTFDTTFSLSKECPPDIPIVYESTLLTGSFTFSMNWLCIIFSFMAYPLVFLSHCIGIWILYEAVIQKEIKW